MADPDVSPALFSRLSHDIRTPLLVMQQSVSLLSERVAGPLSPEQQKLADLTLANLKLVGTLVTDVLGRFQQAAQELTRLKAERAVELQGVSAELESMVNLKDDFLVTINHQLRTPLTAIREGVQLLKDDVMGPLTGEQRSLVAMLEENTERLNHLVEEALGLSLLKTGRRPLSRESADLEALLRERCAHWQLLAGTHTIRCEAEALPPVYADRIAIQQVMDHLLHNALRHAPERSEVLISARAKEADVEVSVQDQGEGLTPEQVARLMEPFTHVHTPDAPGSQGSGLGLAFCRQAIERHRGLIRVESDAGKGTTIRFTLPVATAAFLFADLCAGAQEDAAAEAGQYGLLLLAPQQTGPAAAEPMKRAEALLRRSTHGGDRFLALDDRTLVIAAVTDEKGLESMLERLRNVLATARLPVRLQSALFPRDGATPQALLEAARRAG